MIGRLNNSSMLMIHTISAAIVFTFAVMANGLTGAVWLAQQAYCRPMLHLLLLHVCIAAMH